MNNTGLRDIWVDDFLRRKDDAEFLLHFIHSRLKEYKKSGRDEAYVLNIDAEWGQGKTYFIRGVSKEIERAGHPVVLIDAWQDDFADDPFIAVMAELDGYMQTFLRNSETTGSAVAEAFIGLKKNFKKIAIATGKGLLRKTASKVIGEAVDDVQELLTSNGANAEAVEAGADELAERTQQITNDLLDKYAEGLLAQFSEVKDSLTNFRSSLRQFLTALSQSGLQTANGPLRPPFFILIDELDRCRPTYAITMFERIKHIFNVPDLVFIIATDTNQLSQAVRAVYGAGFNGQSYLQRFFTHTYALPQADRYHVVQNFMKESGIDESRLAVPEAHGDAHIEFICSAADYFGLGLRDLKHCLEMLHTVVTAWPYDVRISLPVMFSLIIGFKQGREMDVFRVQNTWFGRRIVLNSEERLWRGDSGGVHLDYIELLEKAKRYVLLGLNRYMEEYHQGQHRAGKDEAHLAEIFLEEFFQLPEAMREVPSLSSKMKQYPDLIRHAGQLR